MDHFDFRDGQLFAEDVPVAAIAADYGTPCYIYSRATLERHWRAFSDAFGDHPHLICYGVKANSNLAVLNVLARLGSGFDIVSVGELERVLAAGGSADKIVFSGVGKRADELARALDVGIHCFNVESVAELELLNNVAGKMGQQAPVSLRVNPDVDPQTHPYISTGLKDNKFGIDIAAAHDVYALAAKMANLRIVGVDCHIGSQLTQLDPFIDALDRVLALVASLGKSGIALEHIDLGGGLGIRYRDETPPLPADYVQVLTDRLKGHPYKIMLEPGRAIAGNAGILVTTVQLLKHGEKNFAIVDAAMNDLLRPALYSAWQDIWPVQRSPQSPAGKNGQRSAAVPAKTYDIVGPVCESADFLGKDRSLALTTGDLLAVRSAGAYSFAMSSNYNSRPRAPELMVDGDHVHLVRKRETVAALFADEHKLP